MKEYNIILGGKRGTSLGGEGFSEVRTEGEDS